MTKSAALPNRTLIEALHFDPAAPGGIRPLPEPAPHFFALFGLPVALRLDADSLREVFLELARRFHPDFHGAAEAAVREEALRRSSLLNNAHKVLRELPSRAEYVVTLLGPGIESNRNAVPPELLEEMFDIQEAGEALKEARLAGDEAALAQAEAAIKPLREHAVRARLALEAELANDAFAFDATLAEGAPPADVERRLRTIRLRLDQMNYLRTVLRNLK